MKIIFAGTPEFSVPTLQTLLDSEHDVVAVYTQPDRPAGRGRKLHASPIKTLAQSHDIPVLQPTNLRNEKAQKALQAFQADVMVVIAYGLILPEAVLSIPRLGCVNTHPSLLPKWRGAAPIQRSIEAGDTISGVTIMQMDKGMDTGPILKQVKYELSGTETSAQMHDVYSQLGAKLLLETINELTTDQIKAIPQDNAYATYADKIAKQEAVIDWKKSAELICNKIRAFNPWPIAQTTFLNHTLRIWEANALTEKTKLKPGTLVRLEKEAFCVATADGVLKILSVQLPGKKQMAASDFMHGHADALAPEKTIFK